MYELQPVYDGHKSFYGKAFVERWNAKNGMRYVLMSYGTTVATVKAVSAPNVEHDASEYRVGMECLSETVKPVSAQDVEHEMFEIRIGMKYLSATTLRHVKEFLAQIDGTFKGSPWGGYARPSRTVKPSMAKMLNRYAERHMFSKHSDKPPPPTPPPRQYDTPT